MRAIQQEQDEIYEYRAVRRVQARAVQLAAAQEGRPAPLTPVVRFLRLPRGQYDPSSLQDCSQILNGVQALGALLANVQCNPKQVDDHNLTNVNLPDFTRALVKTTMEGGRIIACLGYLHHPPGVSRLLTEPDLEEALATARARASCQSATFELNEVPSFKAAVWPPYPETEVMKSRVWRKLIKGKRPLKRLYRRVKLEAKAPRFLKKRPPPRWCASYPPVSHIYLLTRRDTYRGYYYFTMLPDLQREKRPGPIRWRHFGLLIGLPSFPQPPEGEALPRIYFRWVIGAWHAVNNCTHLDFRLTSAFCPGSSCTPPRLRSSATMSSLEYYWDASRITGI